MAKKFLKAYKKAQSLEKSRADTYKKYSKKVSYSAGKDVFNFLVKAETEHLRVLKEQEKKLSKGEKVALSTLKTEEYKVKKRSIKTGLKGLKGDIGILRSAAKLEREDIDFYKRAAKKANDKESKRLFKKLQKLEQDHLDLINKIIKQMIEESVALGSLDPRIMFSKIK